ncbi:MAG: DUF3488 domain-containing protein, partial [Bdellovibrio sp.]|nr:DUF3488 domain-containing protein [Bdellovibrio sp.]
NRLNSEPSIPSERGLIYEVAIEPTSQNFLFTLEGTRSIFMDAGRVFSLGPSVFRSLRPIMTTTVYQGEWIANYQDSAQPSVADLETPELHGKVLAWVEGQRKNTRSLEERLQALQDFYLQNKFVYTISPGTYGANDLEEFLFERRRGFCEHFAGSYATLARALGIPARVVLGYQGGRYNPVGEFWKVGQKDAHAWAEIFHHGHWQRVDPTMWVAPLRLAIGAEEFFSLSEEDQLAFAKTPDWRGRKQQDFLLWDRLTFLADDLNYRWSYFLMEFDRSSQASIWSALGKYKILTIIGTLFVVALCLLLARGLFKDKQTLSEEQVLLKLIEKWGKERSVAREVSEPPLKYLQRLEAKSPIVATVLQDFAKYYDQKVYAGKSLDKSVRELKSRWKKISRGV